MHVKKHSATTLLSLLLLTTITLAILGITQPTRADTLCVHPTGGSGCYTTIQAAVDAALPGDTINIAQGTYTATSTQIVSVDKDLSLYGGWASDFSERDPQTYLTTLDGQNFLEFSFFGIEADQGDFFDPFRVYQRECKEPDIFSEKN